MSLILLVGLGLNKGLLDQKSPKAMSNEDDWARLGIRQYKAPKTRATEGIYRILSIHLKIGQ